MLLNYVIWDSSPDIFNLGSFTIRWYSLLYALGFLLGRQIWCYLLRKEGRDPLKDLDTLTLHIILGVIVGGRLGHVLFYDLAYYAQHPLEVFLPVVFEPHFKFVGYQGLASHGGALGIIIAIYIYVNYTITTRFWPPRLWIKRQRRAGQSYLWVADRVLIFITLGAALIRIGNFMNSEIIGKPTNSSYGVLFTRAVTERLQRSTPAIDYVKVHKRSTEHIHAEHYQPVELVIGFKHNGFEETTIRHFLEQNVKQLLTRHYAISPHIAEPDEEPLSYQLSQNRRGAFVARVSTWGILRHPAQLYAAVSYLVLFLLLLYYWSKKKRHLVPGKISGLFLVAVFGLRFLHELLKENQVDFEDNLSLNMGQWLSLPLVLLGIIILLFTSRQKRSLPDASTDASAF